MLLLLQATPQWLALSREARADFFRDTVSPVFERFAATVTVRMFDSEYFHARVSDFLVIETTVLRDYQRLMERLRDTAIYSVPYFQVIDIIPGEENAFRIFDEEFSASEKTA